MKKLLFLFTALLFVTLSGWTQTSTSPKKNADTKNVTPTNVTIGATTTSSTAAGTIVAVQKTQQAIKPIKSNDVKNTGSKKPVMKAIGGNNSNDPANLHNPTREKSSSTIVKTQNAVSPIE